MFANFLFVNAELLVYHCSTANIYDEDALRVQFLQCILGIIQGEYIPHSDTFARICWLGAV